MVDLPVFLKQILDSPGLSGYETPTRKLIESAWSPLVDEMSVSRMGSLHGLRRGQGAEQRPGILLAAHMDGIGLMVKTVQNGFLSLTEIGGVDPRILPGQQVVVHGVKDLPGIVVQPPAHLLRPEQAGKPASLDTVLVDVGLMPDEVSQWVRVGSPVSFAQKPLDLTGRVLAGHSLDNRASVAAVTVCLDELQHIRHAWDVWAVATVQEEETLGGAKTSAFDIKPDLAVVIDVTFARGPGLGDEPGTFVLGSGPTIGMGANIHPALYRDFMDLAEKLDIPVGTEIMPSMSGTDAMEVQVSQAGIPTVVLGIPLRYMHTPVEAVALKDVYRAGRLMAEFIARLDADYMKNLLWDKKP